MKLTIKDREYEICDKCGSFMSNPRCLACFPLTGSEEWIIPELRKYYPISGQVTENTVGRPPKLVKHHILEYFFKSATLMRHNQYLNVPDRFMMNVTQFLHGRKVKNISLHAHIFEGNEEMEALLDTPDKLLEMIPARLYELFEYKG